MKRKQHKSPLNLHPTSQLKKMKMKRMLLRRTILSVVVTSEFEISVSSIEGLIYLTKNLCIFLNNDICYVVIFVSLPHL